MTDTLGFTESIARSARHQQQQMWQAAQTVISHVPVSQGREDLLDCLGLTDVARPVEP